MLKRLTGPELHLAAASHHEVAVQHRRNASKHYHEGDHAHAAHQALTVHGHARLLARHANDAAKYHVEHRSDGGAS